jgi:hypothetical protein
MSRVIALATRPSAWGPVGILIVGLIAAGCAASTGGSVAGTPAAPSAVAAVATPMASPTPEPSPSPTPPVDPCTLITQEEADQAAGLKLQTPDPPGAPRTRCVWATPHLGPVAQLEIDVGDGAKKQYDIDNTVLKHDFTRVPDLGDEAYAEFGAIFFRKGDTWISLHLLRLDAPDTGPDLVRLARLAAGRI